MSSEVSRIMIGTAGNSRATCPVVRSVLRMTSLPRHADAGVTPYAPNPAMVSSPLSAVSSFLIARSLADPPLNVAVLWPSI